MPSILCRCGDRIDLSMIPNPNEWLLVSDVEYDEFSEEVDAEKLYKRFRHMLICPNCKRLLIFWDGFDAEPSYYNKS